MLVCWISCYNITLQNLNSTQAVNICQRKTTIYIRVLETKKKNRPLKAKQRQLLLEAVQWSAAPLKVFRTDPIVDIYRL